MISSTKSANSNQNFTTLTSSQRKKLWLKNSGAMYEMSYNPLYYPRLLEETKLKVSKFTTQIERDLHRTFPDEPYFRIEKNFKVLKNILSAYSFRNPNVGYCQGMNFIAGRFLTLDFSELESFWLLVQVIERYLPFEYFSTMTGVLIDQKVFDYLLRTRLPRVARLFDNLDINSSLLTVQWFTCVFANMFSPEVISRLWDELFIHGHSLVYKISLGIFWVTQSEILLKSELTQICGCIEKFCKNLKDTESFISTINKKIFKNHPYLIEKLEEAAIKEVNKEINQRFSYVLSEKEVMERIQNCENEQFCRQINLATSSFFTFMADDQVNFKEDYLETMTNRVENLSLKRESEALMVGKKNHFCLIEINEDKVYQTKIPSSFLEIAEEAKKIDVIEYRR